MSTGDMPVSPPVRPMLAKAVGDEMPEGEGLIFEPKWDGFRCLVFRSASGVQLQSRNLRPFERYVPEILGAMEDQLPPGCVLDGELVVIRGGRLDFDALQQRIHPARSRIDLLAASTPTSYIAFDLLSLDGEDLRARPFSERRRMLEQVLATARPPLHLTPATTNRETAAEWFSNLEGAGLDGLIAKPPEGQYVEGARVQFKVKHQRTADCVVAGFRWHKDGAGVGSLLLGCYDDAGRLHHLGVATSFSAPRRSELLEAVERLRMEPSEVSAHPWAAWAEAESHDGRTRMPGAPSRWSGQRDASWEPLHPVAVVEVRYDALHSGRFRHATHLLRWRPDRDAASCTFEQFPRPQTVSLAEALDMEFSETQPGA